MCSLVMLQISHLVGLDAGKAVSETRGKGKGESGIPAGACVCELSWAEWSML